MERNPKLQILNPKRTQDSNLQKLDFGALVWDLELGIWNLFRV